MCAPNPTFADFIGRIRAGDEQAAAELVRRYEPHIRRIVRLNLEDQRLARLFDSMDVCQEVMLSFFVRAAAGQYDLDEPDQLLKLLVTMARNKLASAARRLRNRRRDQRRTVDAADALAQVASPEPTPSRVAAGKELLEAVHRQLSDEERQLADLRGQGLAWADIAARLGGTPHALCVQLTRALDRVACALGLEANRE
jgi:RNA polymerase sigma-70 factor (ECF subfamily)